MVHHSTGLPVPRASLARRVAIALLPLGALLIALLLALGAWVLFRARADLSRDYARELDEMYEQDARADADGPNRWDEWVAIATAVNDAYRATPGATFRNADGVVRIGDPSGQALESLGPTGLPTGEHADVARAVIAALEARGVFQAVDALEGARLVAPPTGELAGFYSVSDPVAARHLVRALTFAFVDAARRRDHESAAAAVRRITILGGVLRPHPLILSHMLESGFLKTPLEAARAEAAAGFLDAGALRRIRLTLERVPEPDAKRAIQGERLMRAAELEEIESGVPFRDDRARRREIAREFFDEMDRLAATPLRERDFSAIERLDDAMTSTVLMEVLPNRYGVFVGQAQLAAMRAGTLLMLAIEEHVRTHGEPPATLDALDPAIMAERPTDPVAGREFVYRVLPAPDELGRRYLLYSVGVDGIDDGGVNHKDGTIVAWHFALGGGADAVINVPRTREE